MSAIICQCAPASKNFCSNFGFNMPWWDFLLGTYRGQPAEGHEGMTIGVAEIRENPRVHFPPLIRIKDYS